MIWPVIRNAGIDGLLVSFGDRLSEPANRAALAFRGALDAEAWPEIEETASSLVSCYLRFDPLATDHAALTERLHALVETRDWLAAPLPPGRRLHRIPAAYGGADGPQLQEAARLAGLAPDEAIAMLSGARVRVTALGFAPGQPYLGELPECWDIPRQTELTPQVPAGALVVAIRQFVLFSVASPTGWRQVGRTAAPLFRPDAGRPVLLSPGDEVIFPAVPAAQLDELAQEGSGGCTSEALP